MRFAAILLFAGLGPVFSLFAQTPGGSRVNAFVIVDSPTTASGRAFRKYLSDNGALLLHSYPPHAFLGYVPPELDGILAADYDATVYRERIVDKASIAKYGDVASFAASIWNDRFQAEPQEAPQVDVLGLQENYTDNGDIVLSWKEAMKADAYKLQISADSLFATIKLETISGRNSFEVCPAFFPNGVYYWRVASLRTLNTGERRESGFSETGSFGISKPSRMVAKSPLSAPARPANSRFEGPAVSWAADGSFNRYRLQIAPAADFASPVVDVFTDQETYKLSGLPLSRDTTYYMRIMGSDGSASGTWSGVSEIVLETPGPIINDVRRPEWRK